MKNWFLYGLAAGLAASFFAFAPKAAPDTWLLKAKQPNIVKLTGTTNPNSGGTGFEIKAPSGRTYTLSNSHVCDMVGKDGEMHAWPNGAKRPYRVKVIEISAKTDLCLLEGLPGREGEELGAIVPDKVYAVGYPRLSPLTLSTGFVRGSDVVKIPYEREGVKCEGEKFSREQIPTWVGMLEMCVMSVFAYDTSMVIYPGNSGSPVFNEAGEVVGIVFASEGGTNYGLFVGRSEIADFISIY